MTISRRAAIAGIAALTLGTTSQAGSPEEISVDADDGAISLTRYPTDRSGKRSTVLVLHGARGVELRRSAYERYAGALTSAGLDAYLVRYMTADDRQVFGPASTQENRVAYETQRFDGWAKRISSVVTAILARPDSSGHVGLLGFSLGGYIAADAGARDERIAALAVMYGAMPEAMVSKVKRMPPLLEIHGEADHNVPLAKGKELVKLARAAGAPAEQVTYPGRPHGFDFSDTDPMTADAVARVVRFFQAHLVA